MRYRKKVYGSYKKTTCPFCARLATHKNEQGLDVCHSHTKQTFQEIKCLCGSWLELRVGKFGPYFNCIKCGNMNYDKAMTIKEATDKKFEKEIEKNKPIIDISENKLKSTSSNFYSKNKSEINKTTPTKNKPKEIIITSNDVEYFD